MQVEIVNMQVEMANEIPPPMEIPPPNEVETPLEVEPPNVNHAARLLCSIIILFVLVTRGVLGMVPGEPFLTITT